MTNSKVQLRIADDGRLYIEGALTFATVNDVHARAAVMMAQAESLHIDLAHINVCDSAGLALLMSWLREAKARHVTMQLHNVPEQLRAIAKLSELEEILNI